MTKPLLSRSQTIIQQALLRCPPEFAHNLGIAGLRQFGRLPGTIAPRPGQAKTIFGKRFDNPLGLAAGLDKDAQAVLGLAKLGFGFVEVGTVTPRPQPGNPQPRLFRLPQHEALINRMGFNNLGMHAMAAQLAAVRRSGRLSTTIVGVNLGKNKDTPLDAAVTDYLAGMQTLYPYADYFTLNLSSPNTPGLRDLQQAEALDQLLGPAKETQARLANRHSPVPICLKVAPDLSAQEIHMIAERLLAHEIEGLIATNTTLSRESVAGHPHADEAGGLSGQPLTETSCAVVRQFRAVLGETYPIIGVGGIGSPKQAQAMLGAGANLLQIYTSFIYQGANLVHKIVADTV